jgi:RNA polymerase sigma-70 factor (ECF subfamily)
MDTGPGEVTRLLGKLAEGDGEASARLIALVYGELRAIAGRCMRRERPEHTLQATVLVHEAYMRLAGEDGIQWQSRAHFFGIAARVMRRVLLDYAREHRAKKRSGGARVTFDDGLVVSQDHLEDILILDECMQKLAAVDPRQSQLVELRFFAGLTVEETAEVMSISTATVKREWSHAKAWLIREMKMGELHA